MLVQDLNSAKKKAGKTLNEILDKAIVEIFSDASESWSEARYSLDWSFDNINGTVASFYGGKFGIESADLNAILENTQRLASSINLEKADLCLVLSLKYTVEPTDYSDFTEEEISYTQKVLLGSFDGLNGLSALVEDVAKDKNKITEIMEKCFEKSAMCGRDFCYFYDLVDNVFDDIQLGADE